MTLSMEAIVVNGTGDIRLARRPVPSPGPGEVRVRVRCAPVNPSDLMYVHDAYLHPLSVGATPGFVGVGVVEASHPNGVLGRLLLGRRVAFAMSAGRSGTWAGWL